MFEADNEQTRSAIEHSIAASIQDAMNRGDIVCDGSTRFDVHVDTSATTTGNYSPLSQINNFRFRFGPEGAMTAEEREKYAAKVAERQAKWAAEQKKRDFKNAIKRQLAPAIINHRGDRPRATQRGADFSDAKQNEIVALQLLRSMIDKDVFKKYLRHGFVTVVGPSGLTYQIQRRSHNVKVWQQGKLLCTLCVYIQNQYIPPTDEVVAKILMCRFDEIDIWKRANIGWRQARGGFGKLTSRTIEEKHLVELLVAEHAEKDTSGFINVGNFDNNVIVNNNFVNINVAA
jgi:hypothetical protein